MAKDEASKQDEKVTEEVDQVADLEPAEQPSDQQPSTRRHHRIWRWLKSHKKISIPLALILVLVVLAAVPFTRYALAGLALKQTYTVAVIDQKTGKPVSSATVKLAGKETKTDSKGKASLKVKVGDAQLVVEKKYYKSSKKNVLVPILKQKDVAEIKVEATGRQVPVTVINKVSGEPLANAKVLASGAEVKTDAKGQAVLVLPADKQAVEATVSADGYNSAKQEITVTTEAVAGNTLSLTPAGKVYFLSNQSGNIDVVKANLDGTDRKVVLAGTGKEDSYSTALYASKDWKYLALYSKRDGGENAKLFLIETANDKVSVMDEGDARFDVQGWSDNRFIYTVNRNSVKNWEAKRQAIKSFDAEKNKITTLDETQVDGDQNYYAYQTFGSVHVVSDKVLYSIRWSSGGYYGASDPLMGKSNFVRSVDVTGQNKKDLKAYEVYNSYVNVRESDLRTLLLAIINSNSNSAQFFEYNSGAFKEVQQTLDGFYSAEYAHRELSPSGNATMWSETRDGQGAILVGDGSGKSGKLIATMSESSAYGWFTDQYVLVSKKGSELYILPVAGLKDNRAPLKVTGYYGNYGYGH